LRPTTTHQSGPNSFRFVESSSCGHGHRRCPSSAAPLPTACVPPRLTDRPLCDSPIRLCRLMPWQSVPALAIISGAIGLAGGIILAVDTGIMGKVLLRQPPACTTARRASAASSGEVPRNGPSPPCQYSSGPSLLAASSGRPARLMWTLPASTGRHLCGGVCRLRLPPGQMRLGSSHMRHRRMYHLWAHK